MKPRLMIFVLVCFLLLSGCGQDAQSKNPSEPDPAQAADTPSPEVGQSAEPTVDHPDVTGEWYRTGCHSECSATVVISEQTAEGFTVKADCSYGAHMGYLPETAARFTGEAAGVMEVYGDYEYRSETGPKPPVEFTWDGDTMTITTEARDLDLGFGANVYIDGAYTRGEPEYTNAGQLDRLLSPEEQERLRAVAGEGYDWDVAQILGSGTIETDIPCLLADGRTARYISAWYSPNWGYTLDVVLAEDGRTYYKGNGDHFYTDDPDAAELPEVVWPLKDDAHDYFTVPTGGRLGTLLVTVEMGEITSEWYSPLNFSVWSASDLQTPVQTFTEKGYDLTLHNGLAADVNFDGYMDFTYAYSHGAANGSFYLYVWDEGQGRFAPRGDFFGCGLRPQEETKTVFNYVHGSAFSGAEEIYRWENDELVCVREVVVAGPEVDSLELAVYDLAGGELAEVFRKTFSFDSSESPEDTGIYSEAALWYDLDYHGET